MRTIRFITDFATKKKGDIWKCDSMLASQLVRISKVAEYVTETAIVEKEKKQTIQSSSSKNRK